MSSFKQELIQAGSMACIIKEIRLVITLVPSGMEIYESVIATYIMC